MPTEQPQYEVTIPIVVPFETSDTLTLKKQTHVVAALAETAKVDVKQVAISRIVPNPTCDPDAAAPTTTTVAPTVPTVVESQDALGSDQQLGMTVSEMQMPPLEAQQAYTDENVVGTTNCTEILWGCQNGEVDRGCANVHWKGRSGNDVVTQFKRCDNPQGTHSFHEKFASLSQFSEYENLKQEGALEERGFAKLATEEHAFKAAEDAALADPNFAAHFAGAQEYTHDKAMERFPGADAHSPPDAHSPAVTDVATKCTAPGIVPAARLRHCLGASEGAPDAIHPAGPPPPMRRRLMPPSAGAVSANSAPVGPPGSFDAATKKRTRCAALVDFVVYFGKNDVPAEYRAGGSMTQWAAQAQKEADDLKTQVTAQLFMDDFNTLIESKYKAAGSNPVVVQFGEMDGCHDWASASGLDRCKARLDTSQVIVKKNMVRPSPASQVVLASAPPFGQAAPPFTDPFANYPDGTFGAPPTHIMPELPPMEPLPPPPPEPEEPPPLPEDIEPPIGSAGGCAGGFLLDLALYSECNHISSFLGVANLPDITNLDPLGNIQTINGDLLLEDLPSLQNLDGLAGLSGKLSGMLKLSNLPALEDARGLMSITGLGTNSETGDSLVVDNVAQLKNLDLSNICGNVDGALQVRQAVQLGKLTMDCVKTIGKNKQGHSIIIMETKIRDMAGFSQMLNIKGGSLILDNAELETINGLNNVHTVGMDSQGVSLQFAGNIKLDNLDGLEGLTGHLPGSIQLDRNALKHVDGLRNITGLGRDANGTSVLATNNGVLKDLCGLEDLSAVSGSIHANNNPELLSLCLHKLSSVGRDEHGISMSMIQNPKQNSFGDMHLDQERVPGAMHFEGLANSDFAFMSGVKSIGKDDKGASFLAKDLHALNSTKGLDQIETIDGGAAFARCPSLAEVDLSHLNSVGAANLHTGNDATSSTGNSLEFISMAIVTEVDMSKLKQVEGGVEFSDNPALIMVKMSDVDRYKCNTNGMSLELSDMRSFTEFDMGSSPTTMDCGTRFQNLDSMTTLDSLSPVTSFGTDHEGRSLQLLNLQNLNDASGGNTAAALPGSLTAQGLPSLPSLNLNFTTVGKDSQGRCLNIVDVEMDCIGFPLLEHCEGGISIANAKLHNKTLCMDVVNFVGADSDGLSWRLINTQTTNFKCQGTVVGGLELAASDVEHITINTDVPADTQGSSFRSVGNHNLESVTSDNPFKFEGGMELHNCSKLRTWDANVTSVGTNTETGVSISVQNMGSYTGAPGFQHLTTLNGSVVFKNNPMMETLIGLEAMSELGRDKNGNSLEVSHNAMLQTMNGLRACNVMEGSLVLMWNPMLETLEGLQNVTTIGGKNLIGDSILLKANPKLKDLYGLRGLEGAIPGAISLEQLDSLTSMHGLEGVKSIDGPNIYGNALELIELPALESAEGLGLEGELSGALVMEKTGAKSVDGMEKLTGSTGKNLMDVSVLIHDNNALENLNALCNFGGKLAGAIDVSANPLIKSIDPLVKCDHHIESAEGVVIDKIKCLTGAEVNDLKALCHSATCVQRIQHSTPKCLETPHTKNVLIGAGKGRTCGGLSGVEWQEWKLAGNSGLFIDVDTSSCNFEMTPAYVTSIHGDSAHWQLVGVNSINNATATGFRVFVWHPVLRGEFMKYFAKRYNWRMSWLADTGRTSGITKPGDTGWKAFAKDTIYVDVNTTACAYPSRPSFVTAIHGSRDHWRTQGVHSIYYPTASGFRVYVMHAASGGITPADAEQKEWSLAWIGSTDQQSAGVSDSNWQMYCASRDNECGATGHYYSLFIDVSTTAQNFMTVPAYVTSVTGKAHHLAITGGASIFRANEVGFRIYLDNAPTPLVAKDAAWQVNYIGYEQPVDCTFAQWGNWTGCDASCGGGKNTRTRAKLERNNHSGKCGDEKEQKDCNTDTCPVDCQVSAWKEWGECSLTCGGGVQKRTRSIIAHPRGKGEPCQGLEGTRPCPSNPCPVHCVMTKWSKFTKCTKSCDTGTKTRTRNITLTPENGGYQCGSTVQQMECNASPCPINCVMHPWGNFGLCKNGVKDCGDGIETRTRTMAGNAVWGGKACPATDDERSCSLGPCSVDCTVTAWKPDITGGQADWDHFEEDDESDKGTWSVCSKTCGIGIRKRIRDVLSNATNGGTCPELTEEVECKIKDCPVDCVMSEWTGWTGCTKTCGTGIQKKSRTQLTAPAYGGTGCGVYNKHRLCGKSSCPKDCAVNSWTTFGPCSIECVDRTKTNPVFGERIKTRTIKVSTQNGGAACPPLQDSIPCEGAGTCAVHCEVTPWQAKGVLDTTFNDKSGFEGDDKWSVCSQACGPGVRRRERFVVQKALAGGSACPDLTDTLECDLKPCPRDCVMSEWSDWETYIGGGQEVRRTRIETVAPLNGGKACGTNVEYDDFSNHCTDHNQVGEWSQCTKVCGTGYEYRYMIHHKCSKTAAIEMHFKFREGRHCNVRACRTKAEKLAKTRKILVPPLVLSTALDEELGTWVDVTAKQRVEHDLPPGHWQLLKF
jgi:hypothetical protein